MQNFGRLDCKELKVENFGNAPHLIVKISE
jgi:hypothetical protein